MSQSKGGEQQRIVNGQFTAEEQEHQRLVEKAILDTRALSQNIRIAVRNPQLQEDLLQRLSAIEFDLQKEQ